MTRIERVWSRMDIVALRALPPIALGSLEVPPTKRKIAGLRLIEVSVHRMVVSGEVRRLSVVLGLGPDTLSTHSVTYCDGGSGWELPLDRLPRAALDLLAAEPLWTGQAVRV